jgi:hypothetical protein
MTDHEPTEDINQAPTEADLEAYYAIKATLPEPMFARPDVDF